MIIEDKILKCVKEKPLLMSELEEKLQLGREGVFGVLVFLQKHKLVEIIPLDSPDGDEMVWIAPRGLQLLNLPNLPEERVPSNQRERFERQWAALTNDEKNEDVKALYTPTQHAETTEGITDMAIRFNARGNDVISALWLGGKSEVWAKLEQDIKEKGRRKEKWAK